MARILYVFTSRSLTGKQTMNLKTHAIAGLALLFSAGVFAAPQFIKTTADAAPTFDVAGYYIWNETANTRNWHIRWTGENADTKNVNWFGEIEFENSNLGKKNKFSFEKGDSLNTSYSGIWGDRFRWETTTNNKGGVDGIDFTLTENHGLIEFDLGSSLFEDLDTVSGNPGVASTGIFIGDGKSGTNVSVKNNNGYVFQSFVVDVPEPSIIALFSLGLICVGAAARRRKTV